MTPIPSRPWRELPDADARAVAGVLTDIDEVLTADGAITPDALAAVGELRAAGLPVVAVTGRPMGWCAPLAQVWPVDAVVAENGAVALFHDAGALTVEFAQDTQTRTDSLLRLRQAALQVLQAVPGATLARDSPGRLTDIAVDHAEFASLSTREVEQVADAMRGQGLTVTVGPVHVNGWFGARSKLGGADWIVRRRLRRDLATERARWVCVGDAGHDAPLFAAFPIGVGVAGRVAAGSALRPAYVTDGAHGAGLAEVAQRLLGARR